MSFLSKRKEFHDRIKKCCKNVYYAPPANIKMEFPCVIYFLQHTNSLYAENDRHLVKYSYRLTVIDKDPDSKILDALFNEFKTIDIARIENIDKLYHFYIDYKTF